MQSKPVSVSCAPYTSYFGLFRDFVDQESEGNWEKFNENSVKNYFEYGFSTFSGKLQELEDLTQPFAIEESSKLVFMLESLIHARTIIDGVN